MDTSTTDMKGAQLIARATRVITMAALATYLRFIKEWAQWCAMLFHTQEVTKGRESSGRSCSQLLVMVDATITTDTSGSSYLERLPHIYNIKSSELYALNKRGETATYLCPGQVDWTLTLYQRKHARLVKVEPQKLLWCVGRIERGNNRVLVLRLPCNRAHNNMAALGVRGHGHLRVYVMVVATTARGSENKRSCFTLQEEHALHFDLTHLIHATISTISNLNVRKRRTN